MRAISQHATEDAACVSITCTYLYFSGCLNCKVAFKADCYYASGLLEQIIQASLQAEVPLAGENALQRYDHYAFDRIAESALGRNARAGHLEQLTFLRMGDLM